MDAALEIPGIGTALLAPIEALTRGFVLLDHEGASSPPATPNALAQAPAQSELRQGFRIGALALMIRYADGSSLTDLPATRRLPNSPSWFVGMANLSGTLIPVFDLAHYLGVDASDTAKPMLLVLGHGADAAGIVIDGLPQRLRPTPDDRFADAPTPNALAGCVGATCWAAERLWIDLQVGALLQRLSDELATTTDPSTTSPEQ
jgi:chemotaxis signal transduction protein